MKKKVKKIPKYNSGTPSVIEKISTGIGGGLDLYNQAISGQDVTVGTALKGGLSGFSAGMQIGGPIGGMIGAATGIIAGTAGRKHGYDKNSTSTNFNDIYKEGSGWLSWLGPSSHEAKSYANRIQSGNIAKIQTEEIKTDYMNNPNVQTQPILAAEGGIIPNTLWYEDDGEYGRTPYGEIYKEPEQGKPKDSNLVQGPAGTQILSDKLKYPGTKDTFAKHYEKSIAKVKNYGNDKYAKNSQLLNDKYAQKQFDEHLAVLEEMKNKKIKKVKNGIPAHEGGKNGTTPDLSDMFLYRQPDGKFVMLDINGNRYDVPEMMLPYIQGDEHGYWFGPQTGIAPSAGKWNGSMNFAKQMLNSKNVAKLRNTMTKVLPKGAKPAAPSPEDTVVRRPVYEEPVKTVTVPTDDTKVYGRDGRVAYDYAAPETKVTPQDLGRTVDDNNNYTGSNWKDNLYRMAVLSQPLWDRAKAEPVNYESPVYKYMPTQIDVSSQLRDTDQSYALSRYNFANLYPNTGAGMAAGLQAASNRAKQLSDIRQYQTNAQNELIGKNVGIYNNWANEHARIMNDVYNKNAANRAAARNINRQNRATALSNYGAMTRDDKQMAMERMKFAALKPAIAATYDDTTANDIMDMYNSLFGNR